ncbi:hypothetical protein, variant 1 [Verruconis gallopava]|uniref:C2H2-type domain-containing protein n=1 Tax=Verruconis gallopava TaxID=253628 RepID=A0A0D1YYV7_9PEZI|nr:hypothetical protein, variant 1 [Verruconis gallopava]KIW05877.1 hypothetical protein, variant 1 [Verruconis gallopava]
MTAQVQSMPSFSSEFGAVREQFTQLSTTGRDMEQPNLGTTSPTDDSRGRRRIRDGQNSDDADPNAQDSAEGTGNSKKRRRSRKGLDKKFECPHEGCGKSYSRAEHLYRHQLNHNPKQIYHCDFPDCHRSFVRQDLCARHKERHTARGSQLLRKENFMQNLNPIVTAAMAAQKKKLQQQQNSPTSPVAGSHSVSTSLDPSLSSSGSEPGQPLNLSRPPVDIAYRPVNTGLQRSNTFSSFSGGTQQQYIKNESYAKPYSPYSQAATTSTATNSSNSNQQFSRPTHPSQSPGAFQHHSNFPPLTQLPQPAYATMSQAQSGDSQGHTSSASEMTTNMSAVSDTFMEGMTPTYAVPIFGGEGYSRSPFAMADDFAAWLFSDPNVGSGTSPMAGFQPGSTNPVANASFGMNAPYFGQETMFSGPLHQAMPPQGHQMAVSNLIDTNMQQMALSEERRQELLYLIDTRFNDTAHAPVRKRDDLLDGDRNNDRHVLSLNMMQTYIASFWLHFHPQMPILHKPTFQANNCPPLLLLVIITLGASCLEKTYGYEMTQNGADLSAFLAWHLRWEIFMDADFRPPAKLWVFQALLLLEIFEKMYSTRPLHERAHIHHATTLTLMRRGSSLIGRSSADSPPSGTDSHSASRHGSVNGASHYSNQFTADEWWNQWITNEATRRAAFAAFVMDSIHATMFGHSAVMVAHEMRLPLPCDEALWNATSSAEVGRVEQSLHQNGIKPTTFLDGLKKTLNGEPVRTNSFGRTILMAGLLSVSWHMNQRDLQVSSLGVSQALGGRDKWRGSLTRAFDFWKIDLDHSYAKANEGQQYPYYSSKGADDENIFESRTVLHHLAHMAMHVDIVDCQIFAGATRLLGRSITPQDYAGAQRRMKDGWAPTARARDATFYALRFLSQVLVPEDGSGAMAKPEFLYNARDDYLLNRPWVLYFATLIVWSYGYALDGPIQPMYKLSNHEEVVNDMQGFLRRVGGVRAPDDLSKMQNRNACLGLLILMRDTFSNTRWELLHEASKLLTKCIDMLSASQLP